MVKKIIFLFCYSSTFYTVFKRFFSAVKIEIFGIFTDGYVSPARHAQPFYALRAGHP
jgi:hypothetical protein